MTTTTQDRIKANWEQARQESKQRADRIRELLQAAAAESFSEVRSGSAELNVLTRKSVAQWLEDLKEAADSPAVVDVEPAIDSSKAIQVIKVPSWRELLGRSLKIVRDRKGDWLQQLVDYWQEQLAKFDVDMTQQQGDRYVKVKSVFQRILSWFESAKGKSTQK